MDSLSIDDIRHSQEKLLKSSQEYFGQYRKAEEEFHESFTSWDDEEDSPDD